MKTLFAIIAILVATAGVYADSPDSTARSSKWLNQSLPDQWQTDTLPVMAMPSTEMWWKAFNDPTLETLIKMAEDNNMQLSAALSRIESARQTLRKVRSAYYPTVGVSAGWTKEQQSGRISSSSGRAIRDDYFSMGFNASWQIDVFGRVKANADASKASLDASRADRAAINVTVITNLAKTYLSLRCSQEQLEVALDHIDRQEKILKLTEERFEVGLASALDVAQAKSVVLTTKATVPALKASIDADIDAIGLLCGVYRKGLPKEVEYASFLPNPELALPQGVPADLLRRRPDIVESEYQLMALAAKVGIAKKEFLPELSIQGTFGTSASNLKNIWSGQSLTWSVAPQLSWTIFEGFARKADVAMAKADLQAAVDSYNYDVMQAVFEVNDNLHLYASDMEEINLYSQLLEQSEKTLDYAVERYKLGLTDFTTVANAQMTFLESRNSLISSKGNALADLIALYESLGGGWDISALQK
ncbi:MAG: efflux transporter outer membrane subunit [Muribaculum sp.]|nr:efflux transporter outer membrane subunit [Muribaculum sp.]